MLALGVETSCDDTAAALVRMPRRGTGEIVANAVYAQHAIHASFGGVAPEAAAREHVARLDTTIAEVFATSGVRVEAIDLVAVTSGPGLEGALLVGLVSAAMVAHWRGVPLYGVNHLEGHALSARLEFGTAFPYLVLLISGGHCILATVFSPGRYRVWGETRDDAPGEAFDKIARALGLGWPGGPALERLARSGREDAVALPRPLARARGCDFSFSGLKTAARRAWESGVHTREDLAASFQRAVVDCLVARARSAMASHRALVGSAGLRLAVVGGVAANLVAREALGKLARAQGFAWAAPSPWLCGDNAAMIAWAALERRAAGECAPVPPRARARWSLAALTDAGLSA